MAKNVTITAGSGTTIAADEVVDGTLGTVKVQYFKLVDGTLDGTSKIGGDATNGLDVDVTRLPALPAGTNNIGDVDVLSVAPGTGATNLGKAEDAAHTSGDVGVMLLGVRKDTATALAGTDGDYIPPIFDANGRQHVVLARAQSATVTLTIANAATTSDAIDARGYASFGVVMPATFTGTSISFTVSDDNSTFQALYDSAGNLVSLPAVQARSYDLPGELIAWPYWKVVSSASEGASRSLKVVARG